MMHFLLELVLWLLLAFFIGAIIGCLIRRLMAGGEEDAKSGAGAGTAAAVAGGVAAATAGAEEKDEAERRKAEEEAARKKAEEEAARKKAEEEAVSDEAMKPWGLAGPIGGKADNLTRIKGIGSKINQLLNEMGIYHFSQIAAWTEKDIEEVDEKLQFKGRIVREKWVEQAKVLAEGGETEFSRRVDKGDVPTSHTHETPPPEKDGETS